MAQWVNCLRNIFINVPPLPLLCEISGASFNQGTVSLQPYQCITAGFFR